MVIDLPGRPHGLQFCKFACGAVLPGEHLFEDAQADGVRQCVQHSSDRVPLVGKELVGVRSDLPGDGAAARKLDGAHEHDGAALAVILVLLQAAKGPEVILCAW